jgi:DNA polymerase (family X)
LNKAASSEAAFFMPGSTWPPFRKSRAGARAAVCKDTGMAFEDNQRIAGVFEEIADFLELQGENVFKVKAYQKAARMLEGLQRPVAELFREGELVQMPGFGKALVDKVGEYLQSGEVGLHQKLKASFPPQILTLMRVPGLGAKKAAALYRELEVSNVEELEAALADGRVKELKGFGAKTASKLLEGIAQLRQGEERWTLARAHRLASELLSRIRELPGVARAEAAGSLRRGRETIGDLDLVVVTDTAEPVMEAFTSWVDPAHVQLQGSTKSSVLWQGRFQVDLRCVPAASFGAAMQYFTGSKDHNVVLRGRAERLSCKLNEYALLDALGQPIAGATEEEIYQKLNLPFIPPEWRETGQEIEWADQGKLPDLLQMEHIQGNLHTHSLWSDGTDTLDQLAEEAIRRGYKYLAITDHSPSSVVANGLTIDRLLQQGEQIRALERRLEGRLKLLWGTECDILGDGRLDYPDEILAKLDWVVASVHSQMQMSVEDMTARLLRAVENPYVDVIGHPSGRILGKRAPYPVDWERLFSAAAQTGVALEMNCSPHRLDLSDAQARRARELGCWLSVNTDAHALKEFGNMEWGLMQARRAGLDRTRFVNALPWEELRARRPRPVQH